MTARGVSVPLPSRFTAGELAGRHVLVTGASGFVGNRLCQALLDVGARVTAVTRGPARTSQLPVVESVSLEIGPTTDWSIVRSGKIDFVLHLAAHVHQLRARKSLDDPRFFAVNTEGTERLARAAAGHVERLVFVSSSHAMATHSKQLLTEASPCWPDTPYGQSKLQAEHRLARVAAATGMQVVIVRPPAVYGPGCKGHLATLIRMVSRSVPLPIASLASERSLVYVENLVDALMTCAVHRNAAGETFLVSDGENVSLPVLAREIGRAMGRRCWLIPISERVLRWGGMLLRQSTTVDRALGSLAVDISKIRGLLGWKPTYSLADGLARTCRDATRPHQYLAKRAA